MGDMIEIWEREDGATNEPHLIMHVLGCHDWKAKIRLTKPGGIDL
jgi:hypothetical protein